LGCAKPFPRHAVRSRDTSRDGIFFAALQSDTFMSRPIRIAVQIPPGGTPSYAAWRDTVLRAEDAGVDVLLGYDHFLVPAITGIDADGRPIVAENHPPLPNFESWTALASWAEITSRA